MNITQLSKIYREAGIVGAGGAGFPTYAKLSDKAEIVLLNCAECEPLLRLHRQLLKFHAEEIVSAFDRTRETLGAKEGIVCIKSHYKGAIEAVSELLPQYPSIKIHLLPMVYPAGDEVVMIYDATGRVVRPGGLPIEQGVAVFNVETMYNAYHALQGENLTSKLVTVAGEVEKPCTVRVPLGAPLSEVVALAGKQTAENCVYWVGGPMMGSLAATNAVVTKTTNSIFVFPENLRFIEKLNSDWRIEKARAAASCCQCQMCTDLCPRHNLGHPIEPHKIMRAAACNDYRDVNAFVNAFYCSGCGVCELFACPQGLSPRKLTQKVKNGLRANGIRPPKDAVYNPVDPARELRKVPLERLAARLGIKRYQVQAPLDNELKDCFKQVKISLSQHIGVPAKAVVKTGDRVMRGDVIGAAADGLSVNIHSSVTGIVTDVNDKFVTVNKL